MQEMDCVEVIVEKKQYTQEGVHKGMQGWICYPKSTDSCWLVNFPQSAELPDIATISIHETDLRLISSMNALVNEKIRKYYENA